MPYVLRCSYVGWIYIYNWYIFFLDWSLDHYVLSFLVFCNILYFKPSPLASAFCSFFSCPNVHFWVSVLLWLPKHRDTGSQRDGPNWWLYTKGFGGWFPCSESPINRQWVRPLNSIFNSYSINGASYFRSLSFKSQEQWQCQLPEVPLQREKRPEKESKVPLLFSKKITINIASSPPCPFLWSPRGLLDGERGSNTKCLCNLSS